MKRVRSQERFATQVPSHPRLRKRKRALHPVSPSNSHLGTAPPLPKEFLISPRSIVQADKERNEREESEQVKLREKKREAYSKYTQIREDLAKKRVERNGRTIPSRTGREERHAISKLDSGYEEKFDTMHQRKEQLGIGGRVFSNKLLKTCESGKLAPNREQLTRGDGLRSALRRTHTQNELTGLKEDGADDGEGKDGEEGRKGEERPKTVRFQEFKKYSGFMKLFPFNKVGVRVERIVHGGAGEGDRPGGDRRELHGDHNDREEDREAVQGAQVREGNLPRLSVIRSAFKREVQR